MLVTFDSKVGRVTMMGDVSEEQTADPPGGGISGRSSAPVNLSAELWQLEWAEPALQVGGRVVLLLLYAGKL